MGHLPYLTFHSAWDYLKYVLLKLNFLGVKGDPRTVNKVGRLTIVQGKAVLPLLSPSWELNWKHFLCWQLLETEG